jgi:outer membrane protein assembly factor BamA
MPLTGTFFSALLLILFLTGGSAKGQTHSTQQPADTLIISKLIITGNKITRMPVISRELLIHEGDTLARFVYDRAVERTRENLMNTGLFNFVTITDQPLEHNSVAVIIDLKERWYIFPVPVFELVDRNFNEWVRTGEWDRVNYGAYLNWDNFRGRNEALRMLFRWGYSQRIGFSYSIPYINKNQEEGMSFGFAYGRNRESHYGVRNSEQLLYKDFDRYVRKEIYGGIRYTRRNGFYTTGTFSIDYRYNSIADTLAVLNPDFLGNGRTGQELLTIAWQFRRDRRDYKVYPLKGYLFDFDAVKNGVGLLKNEPDLLYFQTQVKYFHQLADRWYLASSVKGKLSGQSEAPYFNQRGFGFLNDFVRGYEYYVIPGQNFVLNRNTLKFALLPTQVISLPFKSLEKFRTIPYAFYLNANFDMGYVRDKQFGSDNPLGNTLLYGYGVGIDYVTYYNLVFRLEYSFNKLGENGFFLHFTAPI